MVATSSSLARLPLVVASRSWREGTRCFVAMDLADISEHFLLLPVIVEGKLHNEVYQAFNRTLQVKPGISKLRLSTAKLLPQALVPFAAHRAFGGAYSFMLWLHDDTLASIPALHTLLSAYDPERPLALTDSLWYQRKHRNPLAPRCLPCTNSSSIQLCPPCTMKLACAAARAARYSSHPTAMATRGMPVGTHTPASKVGGKAGADSSSSVLDEECAEPALADAGSGVVFSRGLLAELTARGVDAQTCMIQHGQGKSCRNSGCLLSQCLWNMDYGFTDSTPTPAPGGATAAASKNILR